MGPWQRWRRPSQVGAWASRPFAEVGEETGGEREEGKSEATAGVVGRWAAAGAIVAASSAGRSELLVEEDE